MRPTIYFCNHFIYEDNLELLRAAGAEIAFFSPLADSDLPRGTQALYLCDGTSLATLPSPGVAPGALANPGQPD
jgi:hypothetical protein